MPPPSTSRRVFLRQAGGLAVGLTFLPLAGCEDNLVEPKVTGTTLSFLSPVDDPNPDAAFYVQFGAAAAVANWPGVPDLSQQAWTLRLDGLVANPLTLRFADLQAEAASALTVLKTMRCIIDGNFVPGLIGNAYWTGIPLRLFLDRAGVDQTRTRRLRLYGADGFTNNLKLDQVYGPRPQDTFEPLLVYELNGAPLTPDHGFPVRLLVHEDYGYRNVKWIERIEATDDDTVFGSYQEVLGYTDEATVRVVNKATQPLNRETIPAGTFLVAGYALSGFAGVEKVEVSIDGGAFTEARILPLDEIVASNPALRQTLQVQDASRFPYPYRSVWALWEFPWDAPPGSHTLRIRATDAAGNTQPDEDDVFDDGLNPVFQVRVTVT
jgi:DMSO/TMAO reductase YedYZ molybdopterin-dependent catalytic subunit